MSAPTTDSALLPDLTEGVPGRALPTGESLVGRVGEEAVLVLRTEDGLHAIQATCPHYGAPLDQGCVHRGRIHCPWHHASFDLDDGSLCRPPALEGLKAWGVEGRDGLVRVLEPRVRGPVAPPRTLGTVVVVGAGAAGTAAVLSLRESGHGGPLLLVDPDPDAPYDRPNLSKDYLAGTAPEEWLPLRSSEDWDALEIERVVDAVTRIDPVDPRLELGTGRVVGFDGLILATGARPRRLAVPGAGGDNVFTLRSLADCRRIMERARPGARAVVVGAGFIGLEVAAALRSREVEVDLVAPEAIPLASVLGPELGRSLHALHERNGVRCHFGSTVREIGPRSVRLSSDISLPADLVVVGVGVEPRLALAEEAAIETDDGIVVDTFLATNREGIYAAGDIAAYPAPFGGGLVRIEHWAVAESQGRTAAQNLLGHRRPFAEVPFFWTAQYGVTVQWSGLPGPWDELESDGSVAEGSFAVRFFRDRQPTAAAFVGRDRESLTWALARADEIREAGR